MFFKKVPEDYKKIKYRIKIIAFIVIPLLLIMVLANDLVLVAHITSGSMDNTLQRGDCCIGIHNVSNIKRGDIISFKYPDDESREFCKRVIGLPGETVVIDDGKVYIDGNLLKENYLKEKPKDIGAGTYYVPEGCYFVMGDNRNNSNDSRSWKNKYVKKEKIIGVLKYVIAPIGRMKKISTPHYDNAK